VGFYQLSIAQQPNPPANDTCAGAQTLQGPVYGFPPTTVSGDTGTALSSVSGQLPCTGNTVDGPDLWYKVNLGSTSGTVKYVVTHGAFNPLYNESLHIYAGQCPTAPATDCKTGMGADTSLLTKESVTLTVTAPTTYYIAVDGRKFGDSGKFDLTVEICLPTGC